MVARISVSHSLVVWRMDFSWFFIVIQLIFLEGLLSIDNAAVLGAMVAPLPNTDPVPWPSWLGWLGHRLDGVLGGQQDAALKVGLLGAYAGRGLMLLIAHHIIRYPWLQVVGAPIWFTSASSIWGSPAKSDTPMSNRRHGSPRRQTFGMWF